jgi:hypothetical protein
MVKDKIFHQFWPSNVPKEIEIPEIRLDEYLLRTAKKFPDAPATTYYGAMITYSTLDLLAFFSDLEENDKYTPPAGDAFLSFT